MPRRTGHTLIELISVMVLAGLAFAIAAPRIAEMKERSALRASRQLLTSAFSAARSAAIQKGQQSTLTLTSTSAEVTVLSGLNHTSVKVLGPLRFNESLATTVSALDNAPMTINYDVRGMATPRFATIARYVIKSAQYADTVCVSTTGFILQNDCRL